MKVKFRGKSGSGEWIYGYLFEDEDNTFIKQGKRSHRYGSGIVVHPKSIGMFTGLHDKNGNEIYEGDIIETPDGNLEVYFSEGAFMVENEEDGLGADLFTYGDISNVIGNKFENPESLNEKLI